MKLIFAAVVKSIEAIEPTKKANGYTQRIVVEQPEAKDDYGRVTHSHQVFQIEIFDKDKTTKFFNDSHIGQIKEFKVWLKGEEVKSKKGDTFYFLKMKLL